MYESAEYDKYFKLLEKMPNDASVAFEDDNGEMVTMSRLDLIKKCRDIFNEDCAWIPNMHRETFLLAHDWIKHAKPHPITGAYIKYYHIDAEKRDAQRLAWNKPIRWPLAVVIVVLVAFIAPAWVSVRKERR
jgi:hypothetical protein